MVRRERGQELDSAWLSLLYLLLGEHLGEQAQANTIENKPSQTWNVFYRKYNRTTNRTQVMGVVASRRKKGDRVSVWVGDARRLGAVVDVGRMVSVFYTMTKVF